MTRNLRGRPIVITGASSGIGAATAIECAKAGMNLLLNARREEKLEDIARRARERGVQVKTLVGDVSDPTVNDALLERCIEAFGRLDVVFSNAGYGLEKPTIELDDQDIRQIFEVNLFASLDLIRKAAQHMIERNEQGHLLMTSSCLAKFTLSSYGAYSATKAAQNHFCRAMNLELRKHHIPVSSVHPVTTRTEFFEVATEKSGGDAQGKTTPDHASGLFVQPPERVARAVVKCLRSPQPEVWTSHIVRGTAAMMTLVPRFMDLAVGRR